MEENILDSNSLKNNKKLGIASFVLGIIAVILVLFIPKICLICSILSIIFAIISNKGTMSTAGKVLGIIGTVISFVFVCIEMDIGTDLEYGKNNNKIIIEENNVKYYEIPKWMKNEPKTKKDKKRANEIISKYEEKYNVNFNYIGVAYSEVEKNVHEVSTVYAFSDEYPEVYTSLSADPDKDWFYEQDINLWKGRNYIYDTADNLGIDTNLIGSDDCWGFANNENKIYCSILINNEVSIDSIKHLAEKIRTNLNKEQVKLVIYQVDNGSNKEYKEHINKFVGINSNYFDSFGNWYEYEIVSTESDVSCKLVYSSKK